MTISERAIRAVGVLALVAYAVFLARHLSFASGGPDSGGYMNEARMIAQGRMTRPVTLVRAFHLDPAWMHVFMPLGFGPSPNARMHPLYPPGLPVHLAAVGLIGGWRHAPYYVAPLAAVGCALLMFRVSRRMGLTRLASTAATTALVLMPPFLWHAVQPASDVLATFWALAAVLLALRALDRPSQAIFAGVAFAIGVWVRPTNLLMIFVVALALRLRPRLLALAAAGAAPFGLALMGWSAKLYGSPFRTGYGGFLDNVSWAGVKNAAPQHAEWLMRMLTPLAFPGALLVVFDRKAESWARWMVAAWFVPFFVFYAFYGFFDGWLCVRFLLPAVPALLIGALLLVRDVGGLLSPRYPRVSMAIAAALALWIAVTPIRSTRQLNVLPVLPVLEKSYPHLIKWAEPQLPKNAIVISGVLSASFLYYADRQVVRYDELSDDAFQILRAYAANAGMQWYAVLPPDELDLDGLRKRFRGDWKAIGKEEDVWIYRLD